MTEDLEPPSFEFGRGRERDREEPPPRDLDLDFGEEEPLEPEIVVRRAQKDPGGGFGRFRRLIPEMSETTARVRGGDPVGHLRNRDVAPGASCSPSPWSCSPFLACASSSEG